MTKSRILETREDRLNDRIKEIEAEYQDECYHCPGSKAIAEFRANRYFRGFEVMCENCGEIITELDGE